MIGINSNGLLSKLLSFDNVLHELSPSIFFVQETKTKNYGQIKSANCVNVIYELIRSERGGGGIAIGCKKDLHPVLLREGNDEVECLTVRLIFPK